MKMVRPSATATNKLEDTMNKYDSIINLPHHTSKVRKPMSMEGRAAQFAPFAALTGHDEAIRETARTTSERIELSEDEAKQLNARMEYVLSCEQSPEITITHFVADTLKFGGRYVQTSGRIKKVDSYNGSVILQSGISIFLADIMAVEGSVFDIFD